MKNSEAKIIKTYINSEEIYPYYFINNDSKRGFEIELTEEEFKFINDAEELSNKAQEILAKKSKEKGGR